METYLDRTLLMIEKSDLEKIQKARIAIFGLGGVGGSIALALARSGFLHFLLVDKDVVSFSNINRQEVAYLSTVGKSKCLVMKEKMLDISPDIDDRAVIIITIGETIPAATAASPRINPPSIDIEVDVVVDILTSLSFSISKHIIIIRVSIYAGNGTKLLPAFRTNNNGYGTRL